MSTCLSWINRKMLQVFLVKTGEKQTNSFFTIKKLNKLKVFKTERSDFNPVRLLWSTTWTLLAFTYQLTDRRNLWMWKHSSPLTHVHGLKTCFIWLKCSSAGFFDELVSERFLSCNDMFLFFNTWLASLSSSCLPLNISSLHHFSLDNESPVSLFLSKL